MKGGRWKAKGRRRGGGGAAGGGDGGDEGGSDGGGCGGAGGGGSGERGSDSSGDGGCSEGGRDVGGKDRSEDEGGGGGGGGRQEATIETASCGSPPRSDSSSVLGRSRRSPCAIGMSPVMLRFYLPCAVLPPFPRPSSGRGNQALPRELSAA